MKNGDKKKKKKTKIYFIVHCTQNGFNPFPVSSVLPLQMVGEREKVE